MEKLEKAERRRKLKKLHKLSTNETLYLKCLERFESHFEYFLFKFNFLEFCNNFVPDFENLYYLLHLNASDSIEESSSEKSELKKDCSKNSCKNAFEEIGNGSSKLANSKNIEEEINANGNQAILLENGFKGDFVSKNVVNLSKRNLSDAEISLLSKELNVVPRCNNIDTAKLKIELVSFGRMLRLKWHMKTRIFITICLNPSLNSILVIRM